MSLQFTAGATLVAAITGGHLVVQRTGPTPFDEFLSVEVHLSQPQQKVSELPTSPYYRLTSRDDGHGFTLTFTPEGIARFLRTTFESTLVYHLARARQDYARQRCAVPVHVERQHELTTSEVYTVLATLWLFDHLVASGD